MTFSSVFGSDVGTIGVSQIVPGARLSSRRRTSSASPTAEVAWMIPSSRVAIAASLLVSSSGALVPT